MKKCNLSVFTIMLLLVFVSCGGDMVIGKWSYSEKASIGDIHYLGIGNVEIEFKADETAVLTTSEALGKEFKGTWKKEGEKYVMTFGNDTMIATVVTSSSNNMMWLEYPITGGLGTVNIVIEKKH